MDNNLLKDREEVYKREEQVHDDVSFDENRAKEVNMLYDNGSFDKIYNAAYSMMGELKGKKILEYGCGSGKNLIHFCGKEAEYIGIDISNLRIAYANQIITANKLQPHAQAIKMNAEKLEFPDNSFDIVYGEAIIHHLDMDISMKEVKRALKPEGFALFIEPRGDNYVINRFRNKTPHLRTIDEHPLVKKDFDTIGKYFNIEQKNYYFLALFAFVFRKYIKIEPLFKISNSVLGLADKILFSVLPFTRKYAWYCILKLKKR